MQAPHPASLLRRVLAGLLVALALSAWALPAQAAPFDPLHEIFQSFEQMSQQMTTAVGNALGTKQIETVVNVLFTSLALGMFVWKFAGYALRGFDMLDLLTTMLMIAFVHFLITGYKTIFPPIFDAGRYVADILGNGLAGVKGGSMAEAIFQTLLRLDIHPDCDGWDCVGKNILALPATVTAYLMAVVLGIIATLVELWTLWGFQIAFAVGWVTVPFLLFERLSFLFDGWLKFFFGMIIYVIVAKVNLAIVMLGLQVMMNAAGDGALVLPVIGFFNLIGMFVFVTVSICTLFCTGKFASAIVNNAAGGGVGDAVQKIASTAVSVARIAIAL